MRKIDFDTWERTEAYRFFCTHANPYYSIAFTQDVTKLRQWCKSRNQSFYLALTHLCTRAANSVENFRYVLRNGEVWLSDGRIPSFTDLHPGSEVFHITTPVWDDDMETFIQKAREESKSQTSFLDAQDETDELIFISCVPQLRLVSLQGSRDPEVNEIAMTWGTYEAHGDRFELTMVLELNHRLIDGLHVQRFARKLTELIEALPE